MCPYHEAGLAPERDFRRAGCDERCRLVRAVLAGQFGRQELLLHAPEPHEEYGRATAALAGVERTGLVLTGRLSVDLVSMRVAVDGRPIHLPAQELSLLCLLARHLGALITYDDIARLVFGLDREDFGGRAMRQTLVNRLRSRLAPDGWLISTLWGTGLRLEEVPIGEPVPDDPTVRRPRLIGWSHRRARCRRCKRTDRPHDGQGFCTPCHRRLGPQGRLSFKDTDDDDPAD